jgi:hypothetical protein
MKYGFYAWIILAAWLLLSLPAAAQAQADSTATPAFRPQLRIGVQGAIHWNKVGFSPQLDQEALPGNSLALVFSYISQPNLGIQIELATEARGWREVIDTFSGYYERRIRYLTLAPMTLVALGKGAFQPIIMAGPFVSFPLANEESIPALWATRAHYGDVFTQRIIYGITGGLGLQVNLDPVSIQAAGRYTAGFSSLFPLGQGGFNFSEPQAWEARIALLLRIGK